MLTNDHLEGEVESEVKQSCKTWSGSSATLTKKRCETKETRESKLKTSNEPSKMRQAKIKEVNSSIAKIKELSLKITRIKQISNFCKNIIYLLTWNSAYICKTLTINKRLLYLFDTSIKRLPCIVNEVYFLYE